jgi:tellurite resistance protein TerC
MQLLTFILGTPLWMPQAFITLVVALLVLGLLNKGRTEIGVAQSLKLSAMHITLGVAFFGLCLLADQCRGDRAIEITQG